MVHVSEPILWISPLVDLILFSGFALMAWIIGRVFRRLPALKMLVFGLSSLCAYDWLSVTGRLYHWSSFLLAVGAALAFTRWIGQRQIPAISFWRKTSPWVMAAGLMVFIIVEGGDRWREHRDLSKLPAASGGAPNVLIIVIDTLRADHLSSYGYARLTSPTIDGIAKEGVLFENAFSTCSWSFPSHVSLLTGRYQFEHGMGAIPPMPVFGPGVPSFHGYPTLGQALEQRGYRTAGFSANRIYFSRNLGFGIGMTHFEDYFHSPADAFVRTFFGKEFARIYLRRTGNSKPKRLLRRLHFYSILDMDEEGSGSLGGAEALRKRATVVNQELLDWIDRDPKQRPFFAFLNYYDVHGSYGGPHFFVRPWPREVPVDLYDDGIRYVDDSIAELMTQLEHRGLGKNTLIVITSDHGESLGQHGLETHSEALYRELIHVPLVFWFPGHIPAGRRIGQDVTNAAMPTTVMNLLGSTTIEFPGRPLSQLWDDAPDPAGAWSEPISELAENHYFSKHEREAVWRVPSAVSGSMRSLVSRPWHLIVHQALGLQLYNWDKDPDESNNLTGTPAGRETAQQLVVKMRELMQKPREPTPATAHRAASNARTIISSSIQGQHSYDQSITHAQKVGR
jgi:arylsulfatase A-like enzyme